MACATTFSFCVCFHHKRLWKSSLVSFSSWNYKTKRITGLAAVPIGLVSLPNIDYDLHSIMRDMGAEFSKDGVVESFGNDGEALKAVDEGVVVANISHIGRIRVTGDDRIRFLHNQSTADFHCAEEGQGCDTVFVSPTARTIDLATAWIMKKSVMIFVSANMRHSILPLLNRYIFFSDKVEVDDITDKTFFFTVMGRESDRLMEQLNMNSIIGKPYGSHLHYAVQATPVTVGVGSLLSQTGYSLMLSMDTAGIVWDALLKYGAVPMGSKCWEYLRVKIGRPAAGKELTDEYNVLEAGLWDTISMSKGCYIGQETVARLITYDGVKQHLWGLSLSGPVEPGTAILSNQMKVGKLTSFARRGDEYLGLGYVHKKVGKVGQEVLVGDHIGVLRDVPFISRSLKISK